MPKIIYTLDEVKKLTENFRLLSDFKRKYQTAYNRCTENGWLEEIKKYFKKVENINRCIYVYEFADNSAYIGLTSNINNRKNGHRRSNSSVKQHIEKTGLIPVFKQLVDFIDEDKAKKLEEFFVNEYRKQGWNILNKVKTGSLGGYILKWTKENCIIEAKKYENRSDFNKESNGAYVSSLKNGWLDEVCSHMIAKMKPSGYWKNSKENCIIEALKYNTRTEFMINSYGAHDACCENGWLDEVCSHMEILLEHYSKEQCVENAKLYNTRMEWKNSKNGNSYYAAVRNGWLDECCKHMLQLSKPRGYWDIKENCLNAAKECKTKSNFSKIYSGAYESVLRNDWLDEFSSYLEEGKKQNGYWLIKENCLNAAKECKNISEFIEKYSRAYAVSKENNWLVEFSSHMIKKTPNGFWKIKENCREYAKKCKSRTEFKHKYGKAHSSSCKNKWMDEFFPNKNQVKLNLEDQKSNAFI